MTSKGRLVLYLILGGILCGSGIVLMFVGAFARNLATQLGGVVLYAASLPLLFQAKLSKMVGRIERLERQSRRLAACRPRERAALHGEAGEEEEPETSTV